MERMSGLDASFLYFESATHLMHIGLVAVVNPASVPGGYSFDAMKEQLLDRLESIPPFLRKVRHVPLDLGHPVWVEDDDFDIDRHVHRLAVPAPAGIEEVAEICGHMAGIPLDRTRPLWEMWFIEGMADGRVAVFMKLHHAMVDGVAGASVIAQLCGLEPTAPTALPALWDGRDPSDLELVGRGLLALMLKPVGIARILPNTLSGIKRTIDRARAGTTMAAPFRAPRTAFNGAVTGHRTMAFADLSLAEMKEVRQATGATVNDVLLAVCGGALRRYLAGLGQLPATTLVANVPVSVRTSSARPLGSNKVSTLFARLGTDLEDPLERLLVLREANRSAKEHAEALGVDTLQDWAEFGSGRLIARALQAYSDLRLADRHPVIHNLVISNIPGPQQQLRFLGAELEAIYPLGPVMDGAGLNITVLSHAGTLHVGLNGCRELMPDIWTLAGSFGPALAELREAVSSRSAAGALTPAPRPAAAAG